MQFDEIEGVTPRVEIVSQAEKDANLGRTDFLTMLVAQLSNQDPLNPQDGTEFTAQLAQFSSLEQLVAMRSSIDALVERMASDRGLQGLNETTGNLLAANLIGKEVFAAGSDFTLEASGAADGEDGAPLFDPALDALPRLSFALDGFTTVTRVTIRNENDSIVNENAGPIELGGRDPGRVELPEELLAAYLKDANLPAGNYTYTVTAEMGPLDPEPTDENPNPEPATRQTVGYTPFVGGVVTGTSMTENEPVLLLGNAVIPVANVLEVREPGSPGGK